MTHIEELRDRVTLLKRKVVEEPDGRFIESWMEGDRVWAQVIPCLGRELYGEEWNALKPIQNKYKIIMRYRGSRFGRVQWEKKILTLLCPPLADSRRQWMTCLTYVVGEDNE
jgi:head-tail adaptor